MPAWGDSEAVGSPLVPSSNEKALEKALFRLELAIIRGILLSLYLNER